MKLSKEVGFHGPYLVTARPFEVEPKLRRPLGKGNKIYFILFELVFHLSRSYNTRA